MGINTQTCGGNEDEGSTLFPAVPTDRLRINRQKLKHPKFHLNITKQFYRELGQNKINMELFKSHLDRVLGNLLWLILLEQGSWSR